MESGKLGNHVRHGQECFYQETVTFEKQTELEIEEQAATILHQEHYSLWVENMDIKKTEEKYLKKLWNLGFKDNFEK